MTKRIALTGTRSLIGAAILRDLHAKGYYVVGLGNFTSPPLGWHNLDLTDAAEIKKLRTGVLDGLINAAEKLPQDGAAEEILAFNWFCTRLITETLIPQMVPEAAIATVASRAGKEWRENINQVLRLMNLSHPDHLPDFVNDEKIDQSRAYALSKEAHIVWAKKNAASVNPHKPRANTISPAVDGSSHDLGDIKTAECVAALATFLVDRGSCRIQGQDFIVDNGFEASQEAEALGLVPGQIKV